jgi:indole-3-glycerol phosphate synthase
VSVLESIVEHKRDEIQARRARLPLAEVRAAACSSPAPRDFVTALTAPGLGVVAEIKRRSPARGDLRPDLDPTALGRSYETAGASAISVLTDEGYFSGSDDDLRAARAVVSLPVLRKDFTIDPYQVYEARALGADAVLLVVRSLPASLLAELLSLADELGLAGLVEVHDEAELRSALQAGARLIGVNNRNLDTLAMDAEVSFRLRPLIPSGVVCIAESGISTPELAESLAGAKYDAILVGEALVTAADPGELLRQLRAAGQRESPTADVGRIPGMSKPRPAGEPAR